MLHKILTCATKEKQQLDNNSSVNSERYTFAKYAISSKAKQKYIIGYYSEYNWLILRGNWREAQASLTGFPSFPVSKKSPICGKSSIS